MTGRERSIFACVTDTLVAPAGPLPPVRETDAIAALERQLAASPRAVRAGLRAMLLVVEVAPLVLGFGARLRRLEVGDRRAALGRLGAHPQLGGPVKALQSLAHLCYYGDLAVTRGLGYDPDAVVARAAALRTAEARW